MEQLVTRSEVSNAFKVSSRTVRNWEKEGKLPVACKVGKQPRYRKADVDKLLSNPSIFR